MECKVSPQYLSSRSISDIFNVNFCMFLCYAFSRHFSHGTALHLVFRVFENNCPRSRLIIAPSSKCVLLISLVCIRAVKQSDIDWYFMKYPNIGHMHRDAI